MEGVLRAEPLFMIRISTHGLTAGLKNATMYVDSLKTLFYSKQTLETINEGESITKLAELIVSGVNHVLYDNNLDLPIANPTEWDVSSTRLFIYDHFLLVDSIEVVLPESV